MRPSDAAAVTQTTAKWLARRWMARSPDSSSSATSSRGLTAMARTPRPAGSSASTRPWRDVERADHGARGEHHPVLEHWLDGARGDTGGARPPHRLPVAPDPDRRARGVDDHELHAGAEHARGSLRDGNRALPEHPAAHVETGEGGAVLVHPGDPRPGTAGGGRRGLTEGELGQPPHLAQHRIEREQRGPVLAAEGDQHHRTPGLRRPGEGHGRGDPEADRAVVEIEPGEHPGLGRGEDGDAGEGEVEAPGPRGKEGPALPSGQEVHGAHAPPLDAEEEELLGGDGHRVQRRAVVRLEPAGVSVLRAVAVDAVAGRRGCPPVRGGGPSARSGAVEPELPVPPHHVHATIRDQDDADVGRDQGGRAGTGEAGGERHRQETEAADAPLAPERAHRPRGPGGLAASDRGALAAHSRDWTQEREARLGAGDQLLEMWISPLSGHGPAHCPGGGGAEREERPGDLLGGPGEGLLAQRPSRSAEGHPGRSIGQMDLESTGRSSRARAGPPRHSGPARGRAGARVP